LKAENSGAEPVRIRAEGFRAAVNSVEQNELSGLALEEEILEAASSGSYPLRFETALTAELFRDLQDPAGEAALSAELVFTYASGEEIKTTVEALGIFPIIRKPEVRITAIAVKKADLINTRFKVSLRIDNPNSFPVELSSFNYELYNAGRLWADGVKEDVLAVPPESSAETELLLVMNFLNMNRELLNQVAAMRDISYRFTGKAEVSTGIGYFPGFSIKYDLSGHAEVSE
jgi:LEA14-like dessication related protein